MELINTALSLIALIVSIIAFLASVSFWRRSFRPIVTASVRTSLSGNIATAYNLVLLNSGTIPAKDIRISAVSLSPDKFGDDATHENKKRWLACFDAVIAILQNGDRVSCSFGTTKANGTGFWKHKAEIAIRIKYSGWFGKSYIQDQVISIVDSNSFTDYAWSTSSD